MDAWSSALTKPDEILLALLIVGHVFADFLVQTARVSERKRLQAGWMIWHGLLTFVTHLVLVLPFLNARLAIGIVVLSVVHTLQDQLRAILDPRWKRPLLSFIADQTLHLAAMVLLWRVIVAGGIPVSGIVPLDAPALAEATRWLVIAAGFVFNGKGGTIVVRMVLENYPEVVPHDGEAKRYAMGRTIGLLERFLIFPLVLLGQWTALGFIVAAKSIARFPELHSKEFADYYLIGTLTSMLVAVATGVLLRFVLMGAFAP